MSLFPEKNHAKRVATDAMMIAIAMMFSYVEVVLAFSTGVPGVKLGLANLVVLSGIYFMPKKDVLVVLLTRILLSGLLFGNMFTILYSLSAGLVSFCVMLLLSRFKCFSVVGVSIAGGVSHNLTQLFVAVILLKSNVLFFYCPVLIVAGAGFGLLIGMIAGQCLRLLYKGNRIDTNDI